MTVSIAVPDVATALRLFESAASDDGGTEFGEHHIWTGVPDEGEDFWSQVSGFDIGEWAKTHVKIEEFKSELNGPFLEAYLKINRELLRLYAFAKYGNDDNRNLTQEDLDYFQFRVRVSEGSSNGDDNLYELLGKLGELLINKMSSRGAVITILGLALVGGTAWGGSTFLESRKEIRLAEITSASKRDELEAQNFAKKQEMELNKSIIDTMRSNNEISSRAVETALNIQSELLKAASKTGTVIIGENHLTREEAKDLISSKRGRSQIKIIEQEFRVIGGNTSSDKHTTVLLIDPVSEEQHKINFRDPIVSERNRKKIFAALESRNTIWVKLSVKEVEGEIRSSKLLDVPKRPKLRQAARTTY
jgi:hypothetical protein